MTQIKVIKNQKDYEEALKLIEGLMNRSPDPNSDEGAQLELLSVLIEDYESRQFPSALPSPVEAIRFRMEQSDLKPVDLVPYLGSRSRVSEILSGKRQLTLDMVRALSTGLGIPEKVLVQKPNQSEESRYERWDIRIVRAMESYGYFGNKTLKKFNKGELLKKYFGSFGGNLQPVALLRASISHRSAPRTDTGALDAWKIRVLQKAEKIKTSVKYKHGVIDVDFMRKLVKLSTKKDGPTLACEELKKIGIKVVIERHLPKTFLDGAAILEDKDNPVIGITLRHDRLDNFWFTLMHEVAHVALHCDQNISTFYDEKLLEKNGGQMTEEEQKREREADEWAEEAILPESKWEISNAKITPSPMAAQSLANELSIHVAVVAGVVRFKHQNFFYLNKIVNDETAKVRRLFPDAFKAKTVT
ncbi:MAG: ImmA/IrrE family metallo-endopeptidase [Patescibacteria group bacterium]|nr:ImmA/IrrE family metallo-endopeptidase [Patescibacteria group bacterium]